MKSDTKVINTQAIAMSIVDLVKRAPKYKGGRRILYDFVEDLIIQVAEDAKDGATIKTRSLKKITEEESIMENKKEECTTTKVIHAHTLAAAIVDMFECVVDTYDNKSDRRDLIDSITDIIAQVTKDVAAGAKIDTAPTDQLVSDTDTTVQLHYTAATIVKLRDGVKRVIYTRDVADNLAHLLVRFARNLDDDYDYADEYEATVAIEEVLIKLAEEAANGTTIVPRTYGPDYETEDS